MKLIIANNIEISVIKNRKSPNQQWRHLDILLLQAHFHTVYKFLLLAAPACPNNLIHKECGNCQLKCGSGSNVAGCKETTCFDGCFCPQGMVLNEGRCVYPEQCPCLHGDKMLPAGSVVPKECNKW